MDDGGDDVRDGTPQRDGGEAGERGGLPGKDAPSRRADRRGATGGFAAWMAESLAHRIAMAGALLAGIFVVGVGGASWVVTRGIVVERVRAGLEAHAALVAEVLLDVLRDTDADLRGLSQSELLRRALVDARGREQILVPFLRDYEVVVPAAHRLSLADASGQVIASNEGDGVPSYRGRAWWPTLIDGGAPHAEIQAGPAPTLVLAYPVHSAGADRPDGALVLELPLAPVLAHVAAGATPEYVVAFTLDGRELATRAAERAGPEERFGASVELRVDRGAPVRGLAVSVQTPRARAFRELRLLAALYAAGGVVALALAGLVARWSSRVLTARIRALSASANRVIAGEVAGVQFEVDGEDEPAQLARALQRMLDRLRHANETLEARVVERTAELHQAEKRLRSIVEHMLDGLVIADEEGRIELFNPSAERIFGWPAAEIVGRSVDWLMEPHRREGHRDHFRRYAVTGERRVLGVAREVEGVRKDGTLVPVEIMVSELATARGRCFIAAIRDVTERRKVDQLKSGFVSVVSHELRTPLTSIRGALGLLAGGAAGPLGEEPATLVRVANENAVRLGRLIDDLLDIQKIEAGRFTLQLEEAPLPDLVGKAIELNQAFAQQRGAAIVLAGEVPDVRVSVDASRFQQVMANLLSNAAKYSPSGGIIEVRTALPGYGCVRLEVADHGPGIPAAFRAHVFEKFSQADVSSARAREGTGLGLAITKALVERMSGAIGFTTEEGRGTTFYFEFPLTEEPRPAA